MEEGTIFNGAEIKPDRVVVRAERNGTVVEYNAKLVVGAGGQDSKVRQALYLPTRVGECQSHYQFMITRAINTLYEEARQY